MFQVTTFGDLILYCITSKIFTMFTLALHSSSIKYVSMVFEMCVTVKVFCIYCRKVDISI